MIVSCHQPNFFPWTPFFEKIKNSDIFVILKEVQYNRHQYQNRFEFDGKWMTMPVEKGNLTDSIKDKRYIEPLNNWDKIKKQIKMDYLNEFDILIGNDLVATNSSIIKKLCNTQSIKTGIEFDFPQQNTDSSQKILNICLKFEAKTYLSGPSGKNYLNIDLFKENGIQVKFHETKNRIPILKHLNK